MESLTLILWFVCLAFLLVVIEPLLPQAVDLALRWFWTEVQRQATKARLYVRLTLDHASYGNGPVARLLREIELWRIRRNPAYKEFFEDRE